MSQSLSELFGDEVSDIKQRVKSEEEIKKYSTNEDMGELKRSIYLLKKGYQTQKISIIGNLNRLMKEPGANEDLLPIILSSMDNWDDSMQSECAESFCKEDVIKLMSAANQQKLLDECLNILMNADITNEEFQQKWINVFKKLIFYIPIETIRQQIVKRIIDLPSLKQQYPWRKIGFELFCAIMDAKGEDILKVEANIFRVFTTMCTDTNWRIRKQACQFLFNYLQPLHQMKKKSKLDESTKRGENPSPIKNGKANMSSSNNNNLNNIGGQNQIQQSNQEQPSDVIKVTKTRFKQNFHDIIIDLAADEEIMVQIDGVEMMTEFLSVFKRQTIENEFISQVDRIFKKVLDTATADEIRIKVTMNSGKILEKLSQSNLAHKHEEMFLNFFNQVIRDKNSEVKMKAVYNLPCYIQKFLPANDTNQKIFEQIYHELMQESSNNDLVIQRMLASSIHETLKLIPQTNQLGYFGECLKFLMQNQDKDIRDSLSKNLDSIIGHYVKNKDYEKLMQNVVKSQTAISLGQSALSGGRDQNFKNNKFQFQTEDLTNGGTRTGTGAKGHRKNIFKWDDDSSTIHNQSLDMKNYAVRAQQYIETELTPSEYHREYIYSHLLDDILNLTKNVLNDKGNWRQQEQLIINFAQQLQNFNACEIYEMLGSQMIDQLKNGCDYVRNSASLFISVMIHMQYKTQTRMKLINQMVNELGKSTSNVYRKAYITFCTQAIKVFSVKAFKEYFLESYLVMAQDRIAEVRLKFLYSATQIRPYLEQDIDLILHFNEQLNNLRNFDTSRNVMELAQKIDQQLIKNKNSSIIIFSEAEDQAKVHYEQKIIEREKYEEAEKKRRTESQEDSKFDYLTLLVNTTKKYGNFRRGGGGAGGGMAFKSSLNKKTISSAGIKQFQSPPVVGKAGAILDKQNAKGSIMQNGNISLNIAMAPMQFQSSHNNNSSLSMQNNSQNQNINNQSIQSKRKASNIFTASDLNAKNQSSLLPPIGQQLKEPISNGNITIRSVRKSELILQQQINNSKDSNAQNSQQESSQNSISYGNQNHLHQSGLMNVSKRSLQQKFSIQENSHQGSPLINAGAQTITIIPSEVQTILKRNQINVANSSLSSQSNLTMNLGLQSQQNPSNLNGSATPSQQQISSPNTLSVNYPPFHHSNTTGSSNSQQQAQGPYSNNYLNNISSGISGGPIATNSGTANGGGPSIGSRDSHKKRFNNEDFEKVLIQSGAGSHSGIASRTNLNSSNQKH